MINPSNPILQNRYYAFGTHLLISLILAAIILYVVFFHWYPEPLFQAGGKHGLIILLSVDMVLGPLLTLIVFEKDKPKLKMDLMIIGILQAACLSAGLWFVYNEKPDLVVLAENGVHIVSRADRTLFINQQEYTGLKAIKPDNALPFFISKIPLDNNETNAYVISQEFKHSKPFELIIQNYKEQKDINQQEFINQIQFINNHLISQEQASKIKSLDNIKRENNGKNTQLDCAWTITHSNHFDGYTCLNLDKGIIKLTK